MSNLSSVNINYFKSNHKMYAVYIFYIRVTKRLFKNEKQKLAAKTSNYLSWKYLFLTSEDRQEVY